LRASRLSDHRCHPREHGFVPRPIQHVLEQLVVLYERFDPWDDRIRSLRGPMMIR
jgi:hypothetical protein